MMRFRISRNRSGEYYFEIQAADNFETLATRARGITRRPTVSVLSR
jgi:uncharacterized protein YegP (UPF0339 family)